jgi:hypothetical protein
VPTASAIFLAVVENGFEQIVQGRFGAAGIVGLLLFSVGIKVRNATIASVGAALLAILVAGSPAL